MAYTTEPECIDFYGEDYVLRSADRNADGNVDSDALNAALESASAKVDAYYSKVVDTPLQNPDAQVKWICADIALYRTSADPDPYTKEKRQRYEDACKFLEGIADGSINPNDPNNDVPPIGGGALITSQPRLFTRESMGGVL